MNLRAKRFFCVVCLSAFLLSVAPAEDATKYDDIKFPQWVKDLRRTEIITFGSLPFVTIWSTLAYSEIEYGEFHNPRDKSADGFSPADQKSIVQISAITCLGLGLTDLAITLIRRHLKKRRADRERPDIITITPMQKDEEPGDDFSNRKRRNPNEPDYLQGGIESAIF